MRLLVVDDDPSMREALALLLLGGGAGIALGALAGLYPAVRAARLAPAAALRST